MQEKTIRRLQRQKLRKKKTAFTTSKFMWEKNRRLQRQKLCKKKTNRRLQRQKLRKKKIGVYNVKIYVKTKKTGFTTSKFTWEKKYRRLQRQNLREKKKSAFTTSKFTWEKRKSAFTTSKFTWKQKKWGLQRHRQRQPEPHTSAETQKANYRGSSLNQYIHTYDIIWHVDIHVILYVNIIRKYKYI